MSLLDKVNHKSILIQLLKEIYTNTKLGPFLGFKGGTALYVFYELNRFSVDLDFDLLDAEQKEIVFTELQTILKQYGLLKEARIKRYSIFFLLSYQDNAHNIKVEVNLRDFGSQYELKNYLGISMLVMARDDMFSHKLVAMFERMGKANRDIYDVHFLLKRQWPINETIIYNRTGLSFSNFIDQCVAGLDKVNNRAILSGIGELLDPKQKVWVKANLLDDTKFLLQARLESQKA